MNSLGGRVTWARKEQGMTLEQVAAAANLSVGYLSKLERDMNQPTLETLKRVGVALNVTQAYLVGEVQPMEEDWERVIFEQYVRHLRPEQLQTVGQRFAVALRYVLGNDRRFTLPVLAYQLRVSIATLKDGLDEIDPSGQLLDRFSAVTGVSLRFFATGQVNETIPEEGREENLGRHIRQLEGTVIDPDQVLGLIDGLQELLRRLQAPK